MKRFTLALSLLLVLTFFATASAHPGDTDEYGGHVDKSTAIYHFHHGEPAHYHTNNICPYSDSVSGGYNTENPPARKSIGIKILEIIGFLLFTAAMLFSAIWLLSICWPLLVGVFELIFGKKK